MRTSSRRRGGRSSRSRSRSCSCRRSSPGFLLSFTFSFDDYVITTFTSGPGSSTLPLFVFGQVKRGVTPETNAVATMMLGLTLITLFVGQAVLTRQARRTGRKGDGGMAAVVTER